MRELRRTDRAVEYVGKDVWRLLDEVDHQILAYLASNKKVRRSALDQYLKKSDSTVSNHLKKLVSMGVVQPNGNAHDPGRTYTLIYTDIITS